MVGTWAGRYVTWAVRDIWARLLRQPRAQAEMLHVADHVGPLFLRQIRPQLWQQLRAEPPQLLCSSPQ
eukprot:COSAG02_NODE_8051_length_2731_cov_161.441869_1_plen_68_part_00